MTVAVGLSGGVDSCVAALALKEAGHDVIGITMKVWQDGVTHGRPGQAACFSPDEQASIEAAQAFAARIGIPCHVFDCGEAFAREILAYFRETYLAGRTPNPCVVCNERLKFGLLPAQARAQGLSFDAYATGHYARIVRRNGRYALLRARDERKDQSYFLYRLTPEPRAHQLFPLGDLTKDEVRAIARAAGVASADRADSQDFYSGDRSDLMGMSCREGNVVTEDGRVLGRHRGFWNYTVGQRKGLGIAAAEPLYVLRVDACRNEVVVGAREALVKTAFRVERLNWVSVPPPAKGETLACRVKIRSTGDPRGPATVCVTGETALCRIASGVTGVSAGQSAVFYDADSGAVLGGGLIAPETVMV